MKAIVYEKYGQPGVLELREIETPTPKDDEVLVKIHAASLNQYDWHLLTADIFLVRLMGGGLLKPKRGAPGADIAGVIQAVGKNVTQFRVGDAVFGDIAAVGGGCAEYVCAPEKLLAHKPTNLSFEQAAAVPMAAVTALQGLRDEGKIQAGQNVLIQGAAGGVGTFAVQIAKLFGAHVTAVCSARNLEQARTLGADAVIDYTKSDFTRAGQQYDLIFAANGYHSLADYKRALTSNGSYVMAGGTMRQIFEAMLLGKWHSRDGKKMSGVSAHVSQSDLEFLKTQIEARKIMPVIDRCYPLNQTADAMRYLGQGHARGKVIITFAPS
jgi:NADPH:quinone reductase-like Zn-dependent oxidoreductase